MKSGFNVLDRHLDLNQSYLLEASAGTGKTYSIENIFVRLLIAPNPLQLQQILVVTFTRAATRDLKVRIRNHILKTIDYLHNPLQDGIPDYLQALENREQAKKQLEHALFCFDESQIFTIHAFCSRMLRDHLLEGNISLESIKSEEPLPYAVQMKVVNDFFRTALLPQKYSKQQIKNVLSKHQQDLNKLKATLLKTVNQGLPITAGPAYDVHLTQFRNAMSRLKQLGITEQKIKEDFEQIDLVYKLVKNEDFLICRFAALFNKEEWNEDDFDILLADGLMWLEKCQPENMRKRKKSSLLNLHYPEFVSHLKQSLEPLIFYAGDATAIMARLASDCQAHMKKFLDEEELMGFDDILKAMRKAVDHLHFVEKIRSSYKAAIIDEFQDTDPIQWDIFQKAFLAPEWGNLYLVGDPKQSIYSFRQADIYTYLSAAQSLRCHGTLDTNYRSQPPLVDALNALFDPVAAPNFILLPKLMSSLKYEPVKSGSKPIENLFTDKKSSVHFFTLETEEIKNPEKEKLFPYIVQEIFSLMNQGFKPKQMAILVKDRYQADALMEVLKKYNIPAANHRNSPLAETPAFDAMRELLQGVLHSRNLSALKTALAGPLIGWTHAQILSLQDPLSLEKVLLKFYHLRSILMEQGLAAFYQLLMKTSFKDEEPSLSAQLLSREGGEEFYTDFLYVAELLAEEQNHTQAVPEALTAYLDNLKVQKEEDEEASIKRRPNPDLDAVQILTIHKSKGLEFDVVFALGLISTSKEPSHLIPASDCLKICPSDDPAYREHCQENDAEKMRQLYVAMTRAKKRLYVPALFSSASKLPKYGTASPMDLFTARLGRPAASYDQLYERLCHNNGPQVRAFLDQLGQKTSITYTRLDAIQFSLEPYKNQSSIALVEPKKVVIPENREYIYSYTALSRAMPKEESSPLLPPHNFFASEKNPHTVPTGSQVGILLHKILEKIDLKKMENRQNFISFVSSYLKATLYEGWEEAIAQMVYNALHAPLPLQGEKKSLMQLNPLAMYKETEFLYRWDSAMIFPEIEAQPGFLKGVIDLIFEHEGKYYLLDWKSNWLGASCQDYGQTSMVKAMGENHYFFQAAVYKEAVRRFIKIFKDRPFPEIFGGAYYIFLRGLDISSNEDFGIYHFYPGKSC